MSVMNMNSRMAMAEKLSVQQLQQAIQSGSLPAYIGIPLIEQKTKEKAQMAAAQQGQEKPPSVVASILQKAEQQEQQPPGIRKLPSNLPMMDEGENGMASGGIVAFAGDSSSLVRLGADRKPQYSNEPKDDAESLTENNILNNRLQRAIDQAAADAAARGQPISEYNFNESIDRALGEGMANPRPPIPSTEPEVLGSEFGKQGTIVNRNASVTEKTTGTGNKVANIPLTTGEMRSDVAAGSGSMLDQYAAMLMDERKGIAKDRQQAKAMAIFQAGLGIAGGTSPNPFANISQGALQGTQAYQQEMKGIRREDADRLKQLMSLGIGKEKLALEARKLGIEDKKIEGLLARYAAAGAGSEDAIITRRLNTAKSLFSDAMKANPFADEATQDAMWANAQRRAMIPGAGTSAEEPKNKRIDFGALK
jgi:hypothetical protein